MPEHKWKMDGDQIDEGAWDVDDWESIGGHGGPKCEVCGFDPCISCVRSQKKDLYDPEQFPCAGPPPEGKEWYFDGGPNYSSIPRKAW